MRRRSDKIIDPVQVREATEHRRDALEHSSQLRPHVSPLRRFVRRITGRGRGVS
ncbi:hypothetical protein [Aeromicrobium sp. Root236]|uniref:hypothetical protein n=1 Tax=Aeromicrobium sp. Root236 TaxID=1736498 RepID=UPI0012FA4429|nr:hypothetical protein [Aeromicrobium sp. Root236]